MMSTSFVSGSPNWIDIASRNTGETTAFYTGLFGWDVVDAGPDAGGYGFFQQGGETVAAYGPVMDESGSPTWTVYFASADADATTKAVEQAGGAVRMPPMDVMDAGRMAAYTDPAGGDFALWQPGTTAGLGAVNDAGTFCWAELHSTDTAAARSFYESAFGWTFDDQSMGEMTYTVVSPAGSEASFGGLMGTMSPEEKSAWMIYFEVEDADAAAAKAKSLGATVLAGPDTIPGVGRFAALADPHGAVFSIIHSETPAAS